MKTEAILWDFGRVELDIPVSKRLKVLKLLDKKTYLTQDEATFLKALQWKAESAANKIAHVKSIIDKALIKSASNLK